MLECPRSFDANSDVFGALQEGIAAEPQSRERDMATHLVERHLLDGVSRNLAAAQEVAGSLDWQWFVTAVETVSFEQELSQVAQASPTSAATLPPSTVPSRTTSKATTEAEVGLLALLHLELR